MHSKWRTSRALAAVLIALAAVGADIATASAAPTITEYEIPVKDLAPSGIVAGPDGKLWFALRAQAAVGVSTTTGAISGKVGISGATQDVAVGSDGNLWFTEPGAERIVKITPLGAFTEYPLEAEPADIAAGPDGNLWFTEASNPGAIGRIDPTSGHVSEFTSGLTKDRKPAGITAGADGAMWFTEAANPGAIGRISTAGVISEYKAGLTANTRPLGITAGPDGALWFTEEGNPGAIGRITTAGTISEFTAGMSINSRPTAITTADDGNLHFTEAASPGRIGTITPAGVISELATPTGNSQPSGIAEGPDGNLWVTEVGAHGQIATVTVAPGIDAAPASEVAQQAATLHAEVRPNSQATTFVFEYGPTSAYGSQTASGSAGAGALATPVSASIAGLTPGTTYHFRVRATNAAGTSYGPDTTFLTAAASAPETSGAPAFTPITAVSPLVRPPSSGATLPPPPSPPPPPAFGHTALVSVVSGTVTVAVPGSAPKPLGFAKDIPVGSVIDTTHGVLRLTTAVDRGGHLQSATIWGAAFAIAQSGSRHGMTTMSLGAPPACRVRGRRASAAVATRRTSTLWAKDNHGRFSTRGQNSVATVRGTYWGTQDSCGGTLTIVRKGAVSVRDLRHHRTVLVRAGHSYLALR